MIFETGIVVGKANSSVMVETIQKTACDSCAAQPGCGHSVLSQLTGNSVRIRALMGEFNTNEVALGQSVTIAIPDHVVVKGSLFVYLVPLLGSLIGAWTMGSFDKSVVLDLMSIMGAAFGLISGGIFVRVRSQKSQDESESNPILYDVGDIPGVLVGAS
jgi:sigma-E factor negative regulatory protein RseC